jgi:hypothetical protein
VRVRDLESSFAPFSTLEFRDILPFFSIFFSFVQVIRSRRTWGWLTCSSAHNRLQYAILSDTPFKPMMMAASRYKDKDAGVVLSFGGQWVSWSHTAAAYRA